MTNSTLEDRCSCGARPKDKCSKESVLGGGKMCVKEFKQEAVPEDDVVDVGIHQVGKLLTAEQSDTRKYSGTEHLDMHTLKTVYVMMKSEEDKQWIGFLIANKLRH